MELVQGSTSTSHNKKVLVKNARGGVETVLGKNHTHVIGYRLRLFRLGH